MTTRIEAVERPGELGRQLRLTAPFGTTVKLALVILVFAAATAELTARARVLRSWLVTPGVSPAHHLLDLQMARLEDTATRRGGIDWIVVGDSTVAAGVDPTRLDAEYRRLTGHSVRTFNLGVPMMDPRGAAALARIASEDYRPGLLVYGVTPRAFSADLPAARETVANLPWVRHRLGEPSLEGWLVEHSLAYRQWLPYRHWIIASQWQLIMEQEAQRSIDGFLPSDFVEAGWDAAPPGPDGPRLLEPGEIDLAPLEPLVGLRASGIDVALVEMPTPRNWLAMFVDGARDHGRLIDEVHRFAQAHDVPFWPTQALDLIPKDGWRDRGHMNSRGAAPFSAWLARTVAATPSLRPFRDTAP